MEKDRCHYTEHLSPCPLEGAANVRNDHEIQGSENSTDSLNSQESTSERGGHQSLSEDSDGGSAKKTKGQRISEETDFVYLFDTAFENLLKFNNFECKSLIEDSISEIIDSFHFEDGKRFSDVDYARPENSLAYFRRYGLLSAGVTRFRTVQALNNCEELRSLFSASSIKLISLGSGPGCDVIGLCSALQHYIKDTKVKLTLVDKYKSWISIFNIIESLTRIGNYGKASLLFQNSDVSTTYLRRDLSDCNEKDEEYRQALEGADVVLISRVFSILNWNEDRLVAKAIVRSMKVGTLLLLIESPKVAESFIETFKNCKVIYTENQSYNDEVDCYSFQGQPGFKISRSSNAQIYVMKKK